MGNSTEYIPWKFRGRFFMNFRVGKNQKKLHGDYKEFHVVEYSIEFP